MELELTQEQRRAVRKLERAFKACSDASVFFHNCYGTLVAYDSAVVESVNDTLDIYPCGDGSNVNSSEYDLGSWSDDPHYVHLK